MQQAAAPKISFVSLGCPKALVDSERIITAPARRRLRTRRASMTAPTSSSSTPAASSTAPSGDRWAPIGEAMAENGKVIVTGCMGAEPEQIESRLSRRAVDHRPAAI